MHELIIIAKKEIRDTLRNRLFLIILGLLLILTAVTIVLGSLQVQNQLIQYHQSVDFLKSIGKAMLPPQPNLNPIAVSKNFVNYIGMIGALMAIILGNQSIHKERKSGTLKLLLSRPIFRDQLLSGKFLGNLGVLLLITAAVGIFTLLSIYLIGSAVLTGSDITRLILFFLISFLYMALFMIFSAALSLFIPQKNNALFIAVIVWLILTFVLPQIGDTMDMDNQLPGGFFAQMGMSRTQEKQVLDKFKFYEALRDGIEELSPTKHYERISFALLGVKPGFEENTPWEILKLKWLNLAGLLVPNILMGLLSYLVFLRREDIYAS